MDRRTTSSATYCGRWIHVLKIEEARVGESCGFQVFILPNIWYSEVNENALIELELNSI